MNNEKRIYQLSVLMPVYNERPEFFRQAIDSVLKQTFRDFEFVIIDDGSTNKGTIEILDRLMEEDNRIRVICGPKQGYTNALNQGFKLCRGTFICRQDSDDWSELTRFEKQVQFMDKNPEVSLVGSNMMFHKENGDALWSTNFAVDFGAIMAQFPLKNPFCHGSVCFRKIAVETVGGYRHELEPAEDYDLFWRICDHFRAANLPEVLYHLRRTNRAVSVTRTREQVKKAVMIQILAQKRKKGILEDIGQVAEYVEAEMFSELDYLSALQQATQLTIAGNFQAASRLYIRAILQYPLRLSSYFKYIRHLMLKAFPSMGSKLFRK
jgi:glycosyltransferase involved in cell wall biosynthesis